MPDSSSNNEFPDVSGLSLWNMTPSPLSHTCFHMPGHLNASVFPDEYFRALISTDTTELYRTDDLHDPEGPVLWASERISGIYGSGRSFFITTGSTTAIRVMLASVLSDKTFILLPRTSHISIVYSIALLDFQYAFYIQESLDEDEDYLLPLTTAESIEAAIRLHPEATDVLIVSPDYYGRCADIPAIAAVAHRHGLRLLVDEAHGAHLAFCPKGAPLDAMHAGADISVMSIHKTLPALTMSSLLHISEEAVESGRVCPDRVLMMLRTFETSSPSFLIAASTEYAVAWSSQNARSIIEKLMVSIQLFVERVSLLPGIRVLQNSGSARDPLRLILIVDDPQVRASTLAAILNENGIDIEFSDLKRLVFIVSPWQKEKDIDTLYHVLSSSIHLAKKRDTVSETEQMSIVETQRLWKRCLRSVPDRRYPVRQAFFATSRRKIPIADLFLSISASPISPYPPGIPILWPGESFSNEHILLFTGLCDNNIKTSGIENGQIEVLT